MKAHITVEKNRAIIKFKSNEKTIDVYEVSEIEIEIISCMNRSTENIRKITGCTWFAERFPNCKGCHFFNQGGLIK